MEPEKISEIMTRVKIEKKPQEKEIQFPVAKKDSSKIPTPMQAMELSLIFNTSPEERKQGWCKRYLKNDYHVEARAIIPEPESEPDLVREEDLNTLLACFLLLKHSRIKINKYTFETSPYQILKFFGGAGEQEGIPEKDFTGGNNYKRLESSLDRLQGNRITTNFWWDTIRGERIIKNNFHFLGSVAEGEQKSLKISLSPEIVDSLEKGYVKLLTESSLRGILKLSGHAKVLALFLLKLLGSKPRQDLNLKTVLRYLGVEEKYNGLPKKYFNLYVKRTIIPAMEEATKAIGVDSTYNKDRQQFHLCRIGKIKQIESRKEELPLAGENERKEQAFNKLVDIGLHHGMITKLLDEADIEEIERQIEWLAYRKSDNPAGILVSAIRNRWIMPAEYEREREKRPRLFNEPKLNNE